MIKTIPNLDNFKAYNSRGEWGFNILIKLNTISYKGNVLNIITQFLKNLWFKVKANHCNAIGRMYTKTWGPSRILPSH